MDSPRDALLTDSLRQKNVESSSLNFWKSKYGKKFFVVLCIHDSKIPLLEFYEKHNSDIDNHQPIKVVDLIGVNNVCLCPKNNKKFIISFEDGERESLKFMTKNYRITVRWINQLNISLRMIKAFKEPTIIPETSSSQKRPRNYAQLKNDRPLSLNEIQEEIQRRQTRADLKKCISPSF